MELADVVALFANLGDGLIYCQHRGIIPLEGRIQLLQLLQGRSENDVFVLLQLVAHPYECSIELCLLDSAIGTARGLAVMLSAYPYHKTTFVDPPYIGRAADPTGDFERQWEPLSTGIPPLCPPFQQALHLFKNLFSDNCRVSVFDVILVHFTLI